MVHDRLAPVVQELRGDLRRRGLPDGHQEVGGSGAEGAVREVFEATKQQIDQTIAIHPTAAEEFVTMRTPLAAG